MKLEKLRKKIRELPLEERRQLLDSEVSELPPNYNDISVRGYFKMLNNLDSKNYDLFKENENLKKANRILSKELTFKLAKENKTKQ